jgi:hypothetical protein
LEGGIEVGSTTAATAGAAAAAAAAKRRQMMFAEEEEDVAKYTQDDLDNGWEFKIVRSESGAFRKMGILQKLIEEEARAGWVMLEKLDDGRVRFKRPRRVRARDALLPPDVDPYRTQYGISSTRIGLFAVALMLLALLALGALGFWVFVIR